MITVTEADEYFAIHLKKNAWTALAVEDKEAAIKMAEDEICARLGISELDGTRIFQVCAGMEQAVFLIENFDRLATGEEIESEYIDGAGSRKYRISKNPGLSPRAALFLERETTGNVISRG